MPVATWCWGCSWRPVVTRDPGSSDASARVFDAVTGAEISRLDHEASVPAVAFSPDGTRLATASTDRTVQIWWVGRDQLIEQAMGRLTRNLTQLEWRRYFRDQQYRPSRSDLP
jgi:hypothetical protein